MKKILLNVNEEYVAGAGVIAGASGSADSTTIRVVFSEDWSELSKYATTRNSRGESATVTALTTDKLVEENTYEFTIPQTAMAYEGQMTVTFTGYAIENGNEVSTVTNTATAYLRVLPSDWTSASDGSITPTLFEQLQAEIDDILEDITDARAAATEAAESEANAASSEANAAASESNASESATLAESYAKGGTDTRTGEDTDNSKYYSEQSSASADSSADSATESESYAKGGTSSRSGEDTDNAKYYKEQAATSATNAATSESNASTSETNAATSESNAATSESNAATSESNAATSESNAADSATSASASATTATTKAGEASTSATQARSYAVGDTSTRQGEATDNAHYYYEQCKTMTESLNRGLVPSGTLTFANLPSLSVAVEGAMYNVSDEFTTTSDFEEGAGHVIPAGTNVYKTNNNKWDVLAGSPVTGVKGDSELDYRKGNVNITKANIGLGNVDNTSDSAKSTAMGTFTSSDTVSNPSWISQSKFESDTVQNNFGELSKTVNNTRYLKNHLDTAESDISTNASNIATNTSNIATNTSNIATNTADISSLSSSKLNASALLDLVYPIGSIYMSVNSTSPATIIGGTWERISKGRTLVGLDENDTNFDTAEETGGSKTVDLQHSHSMQSHVHSFSHTHGLSAGYAKLSIGSTKVQLRYKSTPSWQATYNMSGSAQAEGGLSMSDGVELGGTTDTSSKTYTSSPCNTSGTSIANTDSKLSTTQSIVQPYFTVYMWKRTA